MSKKKSNKTKTGKKNDENDENEVYTKVYTIVNDNDGNQTFEVEAANEEEAAYEALNVLGWFIARP